MSVGDDAHGVPRVENINFVLIPVVRKNVPRGKNNKKIKLSFAGRRGRRPLHPVKVNYAAKL